MKRLFVHLFVFFSFVLSSTTWAASSEDTIRTLWDQGLFKASPAAIQNIVKNADFPPGHSVVILYEQGELNYSADGSETRNRRLVYQILADDAIQNWGGVKVSWSPWHQGKPTVRARVVNPDGSSWDLDESTLVTGQDGGDGEGVYSDSKTLEAPYPHIVVGSVVEEEVTTVSHPLLPGAGVSDRWDFGDDAPVLVERFSVHAPLDGAFHIQAYGTPSIQLNHRTLSGERIWEATQTRLFQKKDYEANLPRNAVIYPFVAFSSAPSWAALAQMYGQMIEKKVAASKVALPPETVEAGSLSRTAVLMMRWINEKVRYIGLELGQNSIVPYSPEEILQRGYGDCKDKAELLVSLLRKAGYKASVALLWNASNLDIVPEIPGLDWFDHAIVYVEGDRPLWLDPTSDFSRDEILPYWDQERWTLPANPQSPGLLQTPLTPFTRQETTETRDFFLKDYGRADVVETTVYGGGFDLFYRQKYAFADPSETKKDMEKYAKDGYDGATLEDVSFSDPKDLEKPFEFTVKLKATGRAYTGDDASVSIEPKYLFSWLPASMTDEKAGRRINAYRTGLPFLFHWKNRIHLPLGFEVRTLPKNLEQTFGAVRLRRQSLSVSDDLIEVDFDCELKKDNLSAAEFEATRKALLDADEAFADIKISFDLKARKALDAGRFHEAFDLYRQAIAAAPLQAVHPLRFSKALLAAGFGEQAILYAKQAVALAPNDARVAANLAWILQHDKLGRRFGSGFDRDGALAAYRKALAIDPGRWETRADYAILLEYDVSGLRYENNKDLEEAVKQYEAVSDVLDEHGLAKNLVLDLWALGRWKDMSQAASTVSDPAFRQSYLLASTAVQSGSDAGLARITDLGLDSTTLTQVLTGAATLLTTARRYAEASAFLHAAARGSSDAVSLDYRSNLLAQIRPTSDVPGPILRPEDTFWVYFLDLERSQGKDFTELRSIMTPELAKWMENPQDPAAFRQEWGFLAQLANAQNLRLSVLRDLTLGLSTTTIQGDENLGFHVVVTSKYNSQKYGFFLVKAQNAYLIAAQSTIPGSLPEAVDRFLKADKVQEAVQWIDWFMSDRQSDNTLLSKSLKAIWPAEASRSRDDVLRFADVLRAWFARSPQDLVAASDRFKTAESSQKLAEGQALLAGYSAIESFNDVLQVSDRLTRITADPDVRETFRRALFETGDFDTLEKLLKSGVKTKPDDQNAAMDLVRFYIRKPDVATAKNLISQMNLQLNAQDYNNIAWAELFSERPTPEALENALRSVTMSNQKNRYSLNTLAALYAEEGRMDEARQVLLKSLSLSAIPEPRSEDWFVLGRIAEGYGLLDAARQDYEKVAPQTGDPEASYILAQRRLAKLPAL